MANIAKTKVLGANADAGVAIVWTAATTATQTCAYKQGDLLLAKNTGSGAHTVTVHSAPAKESKRINDITTESIAAGATRVYGPFPPDGWRQSDGTLTFLANHAEVQFAVITS